MDRPTCRRLLVRPAHPGPDAEGLQPHHVTCYLSQIRIVPGGASGMAGWRKRIFVAMARNASSPADYFNLPAERVVTVGSRIRI